MHVLYMVIQIIDTIQFRLIVTYLGVNPVQETKTAIFCKPPNWTHWTYPPYKLWFTSLRGLTDTSKSIGLYKQSKGPGVKVAEVTFIISTVMKISDFANVFVRTWNLTSDHDSATIEVWEWISNFTPYFNGHMMTSSNGNIFRVTGHLCGEFTGPRWIPCTKASVAELWYFLWSVPE